MLLSILMKSFFDISWQSARLWYDRDAAGMAATVSYYVLFAIAPLLLLTVVSSSFLYGRDFVVWTLNQWGSVLGPEVLVLLQDAVRNLEVLSDGFGIPIVGIIFFSSMVVVMFNTFTTGLNHLWGIPDRGFKVWLRKSAHSVVFIIAFEACLLFLVGLDKILSSLIIASDIPSLIIVKSGIFVVATAVLFSFAFGILPSKSPSRYARLCGGFVASSLFLVAKSLVAWYVGTTPIPGLFGAAGLILILLMWVYVSVAVIYYGAAFAHILDKKR
ncbi:MAG: membrane protein [Acidimicrobiales bacterium]